MQHYNNQTRFEMEKQKTCRRKKKGGKPINNIHQHR